MRPDVLHVHARPYMFPIVVWSGSLTLWHAEQADRIWGAQAHDRASLLSLLKQTTITLMITAEGRSVVLHPYYLS